MSNTMFFNLLLNIGLLVLIATMLTQASHGAFHAAGGQPCHGKQGRPGGHLRTGQHFLHLHRGPCPGAIVNTRVIGVLAAGLLGGPYVGIGAAVIGGLHRYLFDIGALLP